MLRQMDSKRQQKEKKKKQTKQKTNKGTVLVESLVYVMANVLESASRSLP